MIKIEDKIVQKVLEKYKDNYRYLKEAYIDFPKAKGIFRIGETEYMEDLYHLTDVEAQICLNQLCYVFFAQNILDKRWENLKKLTLQSYLGLEKENMYIIESRKKFREKIDSKKDITGEIELVKTRKHRDLYIAKLNYSLNHNSSYGELLIGLKI